MCTLICISFWTSEGRDRDRPLASWRHILSDFPWSQISMHFLAYASCVLAPRSYYSLLTCWRHPSPRQQVGRPSTQTWGRYAHDVIRSRIRMTSSEGEVAWSRSKGDRENSFLREYYRPKKGTAVPGFEPSTLSMLRTSWDWRSNQLSHHGSVCSV